MAGNAIALGVGVCGVGWDRVFVSVEDTTQADIVFSGGTISGNSNGSGGAPQGTIDLDHGGTTLNVQQTSQANVMSVNNAATVWLAGRLSFR